MATVIWRGDAPAIAQVAKAEIDGYDVDTNYGITINEKTVSVLADTDAENTIIALIAALNASEIPEFAEITWEVGSDGVSWLQGTADTAGKPFVALTFEDGAGTWAPVTGQPMTEVTANSGPNDVAIATNWNRAGAAGLPQAGDNIWLQDSDSSLLYNLETFTGDTWAELHELASFTGEIGLPETNTDGDVDYVEYRQRYLQVGATIENVGAKSGDGSQRILRDHETVQTALTVFLTDTSAEDNQFGALEVKNAGAASTLLIYGGSVDVAPRDDDVCTFATTIINGGGVRFGLAVTNTTVTLSEGTFITSSNLGTLNQKGGASDIRKSATITTMAFDNGRCTYRSDGTLTTLTMDLGNPVMDCTLDARGRAFTTVNLNRGTILDPKQTIAWTTVEPGSGIAAVL